MRTSADHSGDLLYAESITSIRTEALFLALTILSLLLLIWRMNGGSFDVLAALFLTFFIFFLFYSLNYRTLNIFLTAKSLSLKFGIFTWVVPLDNVDKCRGDEIPLFMSMGGAGIHFMFIHSRYRASFNFLEYPRLVIAFKRKAGPVQDISFSTRHPDDLLRLIQEAVSANQAQHKRSMWKPGQVF